MGGGGCDSLEKAVRLHVAHKCYFVILSFGARCLLLHEGVMLHTYFKANASEKLRTRSQIAIVQCVTEQQVPVLLDKIQRFLY